MSLAFYRKTDEVVVETEVKRRAFCSAVWRTEHKADSVARDMNGGRCGKMVQENANGSHTV